VVVAVPDCWIDVGGMADLEDVAAQFARAHGRRLRVATKYMNLTRRFFAGHGVTGYRIVESVGATEATPAAGTAELIVDITTTGTTLRANNLKVLEDGLILKSQAHLFASRVASWDASATKLRDAILTRLKP
jgi:ATP phosphoribosyltransferase